MTFNGSVQSFSLKRSLTDGELLTLCRSIIPDWSPFVDLEVTGMEGGTESVVRKVTAAASPLQALVYRYVEDAAQAKKLDEIAKQAGDAGVGPHVFISVGRHSLVQFLDGEALFDGVNGVESSFFRCCRHRACLRDSHIAKLLLRFLPRVMRACGVLRRPKYNSPSIPAVMRALGAAIGRMHRMVTPASEKCSHGGEGTGGSQSTALLLFPDYVDEILEGRVHGRDLRGQLLSHCGAAPLICVGLLLWSWSSTLPPSDSIFDTALLRKYLGLIAVLAGLRIGSTFAGK